MNYRVFWEKGENNFAVRKDGNGMLLLVATAVTSDMAKKFADIIKKARDAENEADAHLIAAAPEMYDCPCDALTDLEMPDGMRAHFEEVLKKARGEK